MHTTSTTYDDGEITINHNSDWSGDAFVRSTIGGALVGFKFDGRALRAGIIPATLDAPMPVVARAVALAAVTSMARAVVSNMERSIDDIITAMIGGS